MGWLVAAILIASFGGVVGGGFATLGVVEAVTGRMLINIRNLPWSPGEVQIIGLCRVAQGVLIAAQGAVVAFITGTQVALAPQIFLPVFWMLMVLFGVALAIPAALQVRMSRRTGVPLFP